MTRNRVLAALAALPAAVLVTLAGTGAAGSTTTGFGVDTTVVRADDRSDGDPQLRAGLPLNGLTGGTGGPLGDLTGGLVDNLLGATGSHSFLPGSPLGGGGRSAA